MKIYHVGNMIRGWVIGKFIPNIYTKDYELGFKYYNEGDYEKSHKHLLSEEVTIILLGEVDMNGKKFSEGDIIIQEKGEYTDFLCLSQRAITAVYRPDGSYPNDKVFEFFY